MRKRKQRLGLLVATIFSVSSLFASATIAADKVVVIPIGGGKAGFGTVVTTVAGSAWLPHRSEPSAITRVVSATIVSGDGMMVHGLTAPASIDGVAYSLESVEICVAVSTPGYLSLVEIYRTDSAISSYKILNDDTDRTTDGCYTYQIGASINKGAGIALTLTGDGTVRIEGTTLTWVESATIQPGIVTSTTTAEGSNN